MSRFTYGALPPDSHLWMMGRTVEEIDAIQAEAAEKNKTVLEVLKSEDWKERLKK